jgi:hypothetical protein
MYFVFCRLYPSSPSQHGSVWLRLVISLLLTNTVCRCGLAYAYDWRDFVGPKKKRSVGLLVLNLFSQPDVSNFIRTTDWRWPLSCVHSVMMVFLVQLPEGGVHAYPLSSVYPLDSNSTPHRPLPSKTSELPVLKSIASLLFSLITTIG